VSVVSRSQVIGTIIIGHRALFREGVAALLRHAPYKIIGTAQRVAELKEVRSSATSRMLILLGVDDGDGDALQVSANIKALRSRFPSGTIAVIAETHVQVNLQQMLTEAPDCYVASLSSRDVLLKLLEVALLDQQVIVLARPRSSSSGAGESNLRQTSSVHQSYNHDEQYPSARPNNDPHLSQREREILARLAGGNSNKQIARLCNITESTVKVHLKAILRKITVHNRTQAAIWAIAKGYRPVAESIHHKPMSPNGAADLSDVERLRPNGNQMAISAK
jgi:two-component system, NarL family, nitrate/nitrite response regulator NarL